MKKIWSVIKSDPEVTGYVILALLIFGACFFPELLWVVAIYTLLFAFFLRNEAKIIGLILFIQPFYGIFNVPRIIFACDYQHEDLSLFELEIIMLEVFCILLYSLRVLNKEKKVNFKILVPIIIFIIYMIIPIHTVYVTDCMNIIFSLLYIYVLIELRQKINFVLITRVFCFGIILSCIFSFTYNISGFLSSFLSLHISEGGIIRFQGLTPHSMHLTSLIMLCFCSLLILKYKQKIKDIEFYLLFIPIFIFGYLTISRAFLITAGVAFILFVIFLIKRDRFKSISLIISIILIISLIVVIFYNITKTYFIRFNTFYAPWVPSSENELKDLLEGRIYVNLIRSDLYKYYIMDWTSSLQTMFFGRGISRLWIGGMNAHNLFLQIIWEHGLVGSVILLTIFCFTINWKKINHWKWYLPILILLVPFVLFLLVEVMFFEYVGLLLVIVLFGWFGIIQSPNRLNVLSNNTIKTNQENVKAAINNKVNQVKLSLIVPVYNGEKYIKSCLDKVLQISLNKEIIVINDGSTDGSLQLLKQYGDKIILINLVNNQGVSNARNIGLEQASGNYVAFIDVDDDFELDMYEKIIAKMISEDADVGICRYDHIFNGKVIKKDFCLDYVDLTQTEVIKLYLTHKLMHAVWTSVYKLDIVKTIKFETEFKMAEDKLFQLRALLNANKTCFVNEILYHYIKNCESSTHLFAKPENVLGHISIDKYITTDERQKLEKFKCEYETFIQRGTDTAVNIISRWAKQDKKNKKEAKEFIKKIANKDICKKMIKNRKLPFSTRFEFFILKNFGVSFHLFLFTLYKFLRTTYFKVFKRG